MLMKILKAIILNIDQQKIFASTEKFFLLDKKVVLLR